MVRFLTFGTIEIRKDDGAELHSVLAHSKHTALLAYLVLGKNGRHRRDRITSLLWPDLDDARARNALSKAIHHLRRALGEQALNIRGNESVGINREEFWCDAVAFEEAVAAGRHTEALALYRRGELLEGFSLGDSNGFEQWLESVRLRLRQKAVGSANLLAEEADRAEDLVAAVRWAHVACELSRHDESTFRKLLVRLGRAGDRAGALMAYGKFAEELARDLELEPSPETRALAESFRVRAANGPRQAAGVKPSTGFPPPAQASDVAVPQVPNRNPTELPRSRSSKAWLILGAGFVAISFAAFLYTRERRTDPNLVAVGMLRNNTGNPALSSVADMVTGGIVQQLSQSGQRVVDLRSNSSLSPRNGGGATENRDLARAAGAGKVVGGEIYKRGDSVLVEMQILDAKNGRVLHQLDAVSVPATNAHTILDRLRDGVTGAVAALADTLYLPWTTAHSRPPKYAAFQEFMQGLDAIVNQGMEPAVEHLKKAIALDTSFVEAKLWLLEQADGLPDQRHLIDSVKAVALAQRPTLAPFDQVSLDRELSSLAGDWEGAYTASRRLAAMAPNTPDAQIFHAQSAMATRRYGEAIAVLHRIDRTKGWLKNLGQITAWDLQAHRLNGDLPGAAAEWQRSRQEKPDDFPTCNNAMLIFSAMGRERAVDSLVNECAKLPTAPPTADRAWELAGRGFRSRGHIEASRRAFERALVIRAAAATRDPKRRKSLAMIQCELGQWKEAYANLQATADTSDSEDRKNIGVIAAHLGDTATVTATLKWIDAWRRRENTRGGDKMSRAVIVLALGRRNEAVLLLRDAMRAGVAPAWAAWYVRFDLQPMRGDPRFEELIRPQS